jgi:hypothetical protein
MNRLKCKPSDKVGQNRGKLRDGFYLNNVLLLRSMSKKRSTTQVIKEIKRATRRYYSAEEKIRIPLDGLRGEEILVFALD